MPAANETQAAMSKYLNNMCHNPKEFVEVMARDHRTLQQCFTNLCFEWIKYNAELSRSSNYYDGRNEYTVHKCKEIVEAVELDKAPFI